MPAKLHEEHAIEECATSMDHVFSELTDFAMGKSPRWGPFHMLDTIKNRLKFISNTAEFCIKAEKFDIKQRLKEIGVYLTPAQLDERMDRLRQAPDALIDIGRDIANKLKELAPLAWEQHLKDTVRCVSRFCDTGGKFFFASVENALYSLNHAWKEAQDAGSMGCDEQKQTVHSLREKLKAMAARHEATANV